MSRPARALAIVLGVLILLLVGPLLVPVPPLRDTLPAEALADPDSRFVAVGDLRVHYKVAGDEGPLLLLLHGLGDSTFSWREVSAPLAVGRRVVAFDRPGFGLTERPLPGDWQGSNPYTPAAQAGLTVDLMLALGAEEAVLVGHSAGGALAALTALTYPERVRALVLVDAAIYTEAGLPGALRCLLTTPQMRRLGPLFLRSSRRWGKEVAARAWHDPSKITPEIWKGYATLTRVQHWDRALWEYTAASRPLRLDRRLEELTMPVLVITGDEDRVVPTTESIRLANALPNARLVIIQECGHLPQEECPAPFVQALDGFLGTLGL